MSTAPGHDRFWLKVGAATAGLLVLAKLICHDLGPRWPASSLWALGLLGLWMLVQGRSSRRYGPWWPVVSALALASLAPAFAIGAGLMLDVPLRGGCRSCNTPWLLLAVLPLLSLGAPVVGARLASLATDREWRRAAPVLRIAAWALATVGSLLVAPAIQRSIRLPDPDGYLGSLDIVGEIPVVRPREAARYLDLADVTVRRSRSGGDCFIELRPPSGAEAPHHAIPCEGELTLLRDTASDLWVLSSTPFTRHLVYRPGAPRLTSLSTREAAPSLAPPIGWVLGGTAGLALALLLLLTVLAPPRRLSWLCQARQGVVEPAGDFIAFADGELPLRAPLAKGQRPGPALAHPLSSAPWPTYRTDGSSEPWEARPGTREQLVEEAWAAWATRPALALAVLSWTIAPLLVAWKEGLV